MKQSVFHVRRRHVSPDIAMVALAGATGLLLGWIDFWLPMARSELSNSSLTDFHYCTINDTYILRRDGVPLFIIWMLYRESVAAWKTRANVYRWIFLVVVEEYDYPSYPLGGKQHSFVESVDGTTKGAVVLSHALYSLPFSFNSTLSCLLSLQCWNCCWLLWEWRDQWRHSSADVLATPCKPHCGRCPRPGKH